MSFFSDLFHGNFSNLGHDLAPSNIFKDTVSSFENQPGWAQALEFAIPAALGGAFLLPELAGAGAGAAALEGGAAAEGGLGAAEAAAGGVGGFDLSTIGPGVAGADAAAGGAGAAAGVPLAGLDPSAYFGGSDILGVAPDVSAPTEGVSPFSGSSGGAVSMGGNPPDAVDPSSGTPVSSVGATASPVPYAGVSGGAPPTVTDPAFGPFGTSAVPYAGVTGGVPPAGAAAPEAGGIGGALSSIGGALKTAAPVIGLAGLGANLYSGYQQKKQLDALNQQEAGFASAEAQAGQAAITAAQPMIASGVTLQNYLTTGTLPPEFQAQIKQQVDGAKAQIIQGYGSRGQSTDPLQNSALAQDLQAVDNNALALKGNLEQTLNQAGTQMVQTANQLLASGIQATDIAAQLPILMQNLNLKLAQFTTQSISNFAAALNGQQRSTQGGFSINYNPTSGAIQ